jgi:hypothetical protein
MRFWRLNRNHGFGYCNAVWCGCGTIFFKNVVNHGLQKMTPRRALLCMWRARAHLQPRHALLNELARVAPALALAARATHRLYRSAPDYVAIAPSRFITVKLNELLRSALESNRDQTQKTIRREIGLSRKRLTVLCW